MGNDIPYKRKFQYTGYTIFGHGPYYENCFAALKNYKPKNQGQTGTCYAYAIAGIIYLATDRIYGREKINFEELKKTIITCYGEKDGGDVHKILMNTSLLSDYRLRCREVNTDDAFAILTQNNPRPILATFYLSGVEWNGLINFFKINPNGIITKEDLTKYFNPEFESEDGGHAVIIIGCFSWRKGFYFNIVNSWGDTWGNEGKFYADIFATKFQFYDVYWTESDLTYEEKMNYSYHFPKEFE